MKAPRMKTAMSTVTVAATDTAAFVRAQLQRGVSIETLQRQLKIRPEHMLDLLSRAPEPPLPKVELAHKPHHLPTSGWGAVRIAMPPSALGISKAEMLRRSMENRALAYRLAEMVLPTVASITRVDRGRIAGADKSSSATNIRAMVFALMHEMAPTCPLVAIGHALNRQSAAVDSALLRCQRLREISADYNGQYLRALVRLTP